MSINEQDIVKTRARIMEAARKMLDGEMSYIEGSRTICGLCPSARLNPLTDPFIVFIGIDSETNEIPMGPLLDQWSQEGKLRKKHEWADTERWAKQYGESACREVIAFLTGNHNLL